MVELYIHKNQGITDAIKSELNSQGYNTSKITDSIWLGIMQEVSNQNTQNIREGKKEIFTGGTDLKGDSHKNFVVKEGIIEIAQSIWNKIVSLVTGKTETAYQPQNSSVVLETNKNNKSKFDETVNQAKEAILQNVGNLELDNGDKEKIKGFLSEFSPELVSEELRNDDVSLSEAAFQMLSLVLNNPLKSVAVVGQLINNDNRFEDIEINDVSAPSSIQGKKISEFANAILNNTPDKIKGMYDVAQERLVQYITSNPDIEFNSPYDSNRKIKASELLEYINSIQCRKDDYGSAQAYDFTPDDEIHEWNGILINTNKFCCDPYLSEADAIKILVHESLHCAFSKEHFAFNNQREEMFCERQAIQLTSSLVSANNFEITDIQSSYGLSYKEFNGMNETELTVFLQDKFINKGGYANRPKNTDGDVNINGKEIMHGDEVILNGTKIGIIGTVNGKMSRESCIIDQLDKSNINMSIPNGAGRVVFAGTQPKGALPLAIKRGNNTIFTAYFIPMQPN